MHIKVKYIEDKGRQTYISDRQYTIIVLSALLSWFLQYYFLESQYAFSKLNASKAYVILKKNNTLFSVSD